MTIKDLYTMLDEPEIEKNAFFTDETLRAHNDFIDKYIYTTDFPEKQQDDVMFEFEQVCTADKATAFKVGFKTALELMRSLL